MDSAASEGAWMRLRSEARANAAKPDALTAGQLLWRHRDFNMLWLGQGISSVGSQVTVLALPLTGVLYLHASTIQVGLLSAAGILAYSGPSLLFGVLADRMRRRPLMIAADMGRTLVIALIPVLAWAHALSMPVMYAVALTQGCLTVIFDVSYRAYLPSLVGKDALLAGNSRLQGTSSVAQVMGPGLGGTLMELLGPPFALLVDAASFVASWASLLWIRTPELPPERRPGSQRGVRAVLGEVGAGLRFIYRSPVLRAVSGSASIFNFFSQLQITLFLVYAPRVRHITAGGVGLIFVCFGIGGVVASTVVRRHITRFGYGPMLLVGYTLGAAMVLCIGLVPGSATVATGIYTIVYFICGYGLVTANIAMSTLRQIATPAPLQGRVTASFRFAVMALMPISALLAGVLGEQFGLRTALFICSAGMPVSVIWICLSPARKVHAAEEIAQPEPDRPAGLPPAAQPDPAVAHLELSDVARVGVQADALAPAPGDREQGVLDDLVVRGPVDQGDHGAGTRPEPGLRQDQPDLFAHGVGVAQPVGGGEVAQQRIAEHGPADLAAVGARYAAAHVELQQAQPAGVGVHVRPHPLGQPRGPGEQRRLGLDLGQARVPGERAQVAVVEQIWQAGQRRLNVPQVAVYLRGLGVTDEQRLGQVLPPVPRPDHAVHGHDSPQAARRVPVPGHLAEVAGGQRGPVDGGGPG